MVNVYRRRCSHHACSTIPSFIFESSKMAAYCKQHAEDWMANVHNRRCSHESCVKKRAPTSKAVRQRLTASNMPKTGW